MIINLTQHPASAEQAAAGVVDAGRVGVCRPGQPEGRELLATLLTFSSPPSGDLIRGRAEAIAELARSAGADAAMIGGAPFLMAALEAALRRRGIPPLYAFSRRESSEVVAADGGVKKVSIFRHLGFVEAAGGNA